MHASPLEEMGDAGKHHVGDARDGGNRRRRDHEANAEMMTKNDQQTVLVNYMIGI